MRHFPGAGKAENPNILRLPLALIQREKQDRHFYNIKRDIYPDFKGVFDQGLLDYNQSLRMVASGPIDLAHIPLQQNDESHDCAPE